jgi:DNA-binding beta-propeller fold protein YncE
MRRLAVSAALILPVLASVAKASPSSSPTECNQLAPEPISWVDLPGPQAFQALSTKDGCWIFVSLATGHDEASDSDPAGQIAVFARKAGRIALRRVVHVGGNPTGMALTHDGRMLIIADGNRVAFLDIARLIAGRGNFVLGFWNDGSETPGRTYVSVTSDDVYLFVSDEQVGTISVINLAKAKASHFAATAMVGRIPVGNGPIAVTLSRDEKYLYSTSQFMDASNDWPLECQPEWDPKAPKNPQGAIFVIDVPMAKADPAHSVVSIVRAGCTPVRLVLSPKGDIAYVAARGENALFAFDTGKLGRDPTRSLIGKISTGSTPIGIAVIDGGRRIVVTNSNRFGEKSSADQSLLVVDASRIGSADTAILGSIPAGSLPREMALSSDQRTLFVVNTNSKNLEVLDLARLTVRTAPPQPTIAGINDYYPDASKRAKDVGRVVVHFTIGASGVPEEPITIDERQSDAHPRLQNATRQIFHKLQFEAGDAYKRDLTASVVFELAPCGNISHANDVDYRVNLCLELPPQIEGPHPF